MQQEVNSLTWGDFPYQTSIQLPTDHSVFLSLAKAAMRDAELLSRDRALMVKALASDGSWLPTGGKQFNVRLPYSAYDRINKILEKTKEAQFPFRTKRDFFLRMAYERWKMLEPAAARAYREWVLVEAIRKKRHHGTSAQATYIRTHCRDLIEKHDPRTAQAMSAADDRRRRRMLSPLDVVLGRTDPDSDKATYVELQIRQAILGAKGDAQGQGQGQSQRTVTHDEITTLLHTAIGLLCLSKLWPAIVRAQQDNDFRVALGMGLHDLGQRLMTTAKGGDD